HACRFPPPRPPGGAPDAAVPGTGGSTGRAAAGRRPRVLRRRFLCSVGVEGDQPGVRERAVLAAAAPGRGVARVDRTLVSPGVRLPGFRLGLPQRARGGSTDAHGPARPTDSRGTGHLPGELRRLRGGVSTWRNECWWAPRTLTTSVLCKNLDT